MLRSATRRNSSPGGPRRALRARERRWREREHLAALSIEQDRILITEDKDFGELAVRHGKPLPGVILLRIAPENRRLKSARVLALLASQGKRLPGNYVVVDETSVRLRPIPTAP